MACGFKALEFWILCLSLTAASLVGSTIFDPKTLVIDASNGTTIEDQLGTKYKHDSDYETLFFGNVLVGSVFYTLLVLLIVHCCPSKHQIRRHGRKTYMLRFVQCMKLLTLASVPFTHTVGLMEFKTGEPLVVGAVLMVCEFLSAFMELLSLLHTIDPTRPLGIFMGTAIELLGSAMVAAQLVNVREIHVLYASGGVSVCLALCMATCVSEPEALEKLVTPVGFASGLGLAVAFEGIHQFKHQEELVAYALLFAFNFIVPYLKDNYESIAIPAEYERSYHRETLLQSQV